MSQICDKFFFEKKLSQKNFSELQASTLPRNAHP